MTGRRDLLATVAGAGVAALAGCITVKDADAGGGGGGGGDTGGEATVTATATAADAGGGDGGGGAATTVTTGAGGDGGDGEPDSTLEALEEEYPNAWAYDGRYGLVVLEASASIDEYSTRVTGTVLNASDEDYDYVSLSFSLLDARGTKRADAIANTNGLRAGQRWRFEAVGESDPAIETFRLVGITAY